MKIICYGFECEWRVDGGGLVAVRGVYGLGLQDRIQRKIPVCDLARPGPTSDTMEECAISPADCALHILPWLSV